MGKGDHLLFVGLVVLGPKGNGVIVHPGDPGVADGDPMRVPSRIFDGVAGAMKGLFHVGEPGFPIKGITKAGPHAGLTELPAGAGKGQFPGTEQAGKLVQELSAEQITKCPDGKEEAAAAANETFGFGQAAAGDDAVDMGVKLQLLPPGVEDLYDPRRSAQERFICRQFQERLCRAGMKQAVQQRLVGVDEWAKLRRDREDHVEIGSVDDFRSAGVDPDLFEESLAAGTVPVSAGIVMALRVAAITANGDVVAKFPGFAGHDGTGGFVLLPSGLEAATIGFVSRMEDLLDIIHVSSPQAGQKGCVRGPARHWPSGRKWRWKRWICGP